jgi:amidohydrolase
MQTNLIPEIKSAAKQLLPRITNVRRELHKNPELSFQEINTSQRIKEFLVQEGIEFSEGWAGYGIVASVKGIHAGYSKMFRADMDALPIKEENNIDYKSVNEGVMHACGHDVHTSSLLGAAAIVNKLKQNLTGEIKFVFQPGEEKLPGGASIMLSEGLFRPAPPKCIIAQHVYPSLPAGHVGFRKGLYMASADEIYVTINGKGGHAATPHLCIDPILIASRVIVGLQEIISRHVDPMMPGVLTIGKINSDGGATNVIPDVVHLAGTLRAMDENWRYKAHQLIKDFIVHTCEASGGTAEVRIEVGYPSLKNDDLLTDRCKEAAIQYLGQDKVHELPQRMSSEDFAFYTHQAPGTFYRLGTGGESEDINFPVHSNRFNIDEAALETGMGIMAYLALKPDLVS